MLLLALGEYLVSLDGKCMCATFSLSKSSQCNLMQAYIEFLIRFGCVYLFIVLSIAVYVFWSVNALVKLCFTITPPWIKRKDDQSCSDNS